MTHRVRTRSVILAAVLLVTGSCSNGSSEQRSQDPANPNTSVPLPTVTNSPESFDFAAVTVEWGELLSDESVNTVRGSVLGAGDRTVEIDVTDDLTDRGVTTGETTYSLDSVGGLTTGARINEVLDHRSGSLPVLAIADSAGNALHLIELDDSGLAFHPVADPTETVSLNTNSLWIRRAIESGEMVIRIEQPVDPDTSTYCQDIGGFSSSPFTPGEDEVADWVAFAIAAYEATRGHSLQATIARADEVASASVSTDEVTGFSSSFWNSDVISQALRGVPEEDWELIPTVTVFVDPGEYLWQKDGEQYVVFSETGTDRVLGWLLYSGLDTFEEPDAAEMMTPPTGGDVAIHLSDGRGGVGCLEGIGEASLIVPFDDVAGSRRAIIHLDTASYSNWQRQK